MPSTLGEPQFAPCPHCQEIHPEEALMCPRYGEPLPLQGRLLDGKFRFVHLLGEGGMGAVWKAENVLVHKSVAIKLMHGQYARDERTMERFRNEATAAGRIGNDHICDILDLGRSQLGPYIVMELMKGRSLAELIEPGRIDTGLAVLIVRQALVGLEAAHKANIIHRDLKPENLFLHEPAPGRLMVKLMDFGISKFVEAGQSKTGVGVLMGTPEYMSPEQAEGAAGVDLRTDIWAMGVILYRAVTGKEAFLAPTLAATLLGVSTKEPTPIRTLVSEAPEGLEAVIRRCLAKNPDDRYSSAAELSAALAPFEVLGSQPAVVQPVARPSSTEAPHGTPNPAVPATIPSAATSADTILADSAQASAPQASPAAPVVAPSPGPEESWTLSASDVTDRPTSTLSEQRSPLWIVIVLLVLGGVGAAFIFMPRDKGDEVLAASDEDGTGGEGGEAAVAGSSASGKSSTAGKAPVDTGPSVRTGSGAPATGAGQAASTAAGTKGPPDETGGGADTGAAGSGDETGGGATDTNAGTRGAEDDGGDTGAASSGGSSGGRPTPSVKVEQGKVYRSGGLYAPRAQTGPVALAQARQHCSRLKQQKFAGLSGWRMASGAEIGRFKGKVAATLYWTSKSTAYNMFRGAETPSKPGAKARPFCVSAKK